jgi:hypothetical protein
MPYREPPPGNLPDDVHLSPQLAARLIRRLEERAVHELDVAALTVAGGDQVGILCLAELTSWLSGWAVRAEAGEHP